MRREPESESKPGSESTLESESDTYRPACPYCGSTDVTLESAFGSEISKSQYYCRGCRTMFERLKYDGERPDTGR